MSKLPIIVLHGALGSTEQLSPLKDELDKNFEVHFLNFSGHGGQPFAEEFSIAQFAHELAQYIEEHQLAPANIFGYSMGGYVALQLAHDQPDLVNKIYTLGTKFDWTPSTAANEIKMLNPEKILEKVPKFAEALAQRHKPNDWREVMQRTADLMLALGNGQALTPQSFNTINQEVVVGIGEEDNMVSIEESSEVANALLNGTLKKYPNLKHPVELVDAKELAKNLRQFFK